MNVEIRLWHSITLSCILFCFLCSENAYATGKLTEKNHRQLTKIHALIKQQKWSSAETNLAMLLTKKQDSYTHAILLQTAAQISIEQQQHAKTILQLSQAHELNSLPDTAMKAIEYNLAQLHSQAQQHQKSMKFLRLWLMRNPNLSGQQHIFASYVLTQGKHYQDAIQHCQTAIQQVQPAPNSWYEMLASIYLMQQQYKKAISIYKTLIKRQPQQLKYWQQLTQLYLQTQQPQQALATLVLADEQHLINKPAEILQLVNLYNQRKQPYKAAERLHKAISQQHMVAKNTQWQHVAQLWTAARQYLRAIQAWQHIIDRHPENNLATLAQAKLRITLQQWPEVQKVLTDMTKQSKLTTTSTTMAEAHYLLGIALYYNNLPEKALDAFKLARKFPTYRVQADLWLNIIEK
jgi:tetratricopeptide (TPR) repeat protein